MNDTTKIEMQPSPFPFQQKVRNSITTAAIAVMMYVCETATVTDRQILRLPVVILSCLRTEAFSLSHWSYPLIPAG